MYRYVALSWNWKDSARSSVAKGLGHLLLSSSVDWRSVFEAPGLRVFHVRQPRSAYHAYVLRDGGVLLGKVFGESVNENGVETSLTIDDDEARLILESRGRRLIDRYWGHYLAFLRASGGHQRVVLRDPTGGLPCFLIKTGGVDVVLSDMEDCVRLNLMPFSVNWSHLTAFFLHSRLITQATGFKEVELLHAGECAVFQDDAAMTKVSRSFYWNPLQFCDGDLIEAPDQAREAIAAVVRRCINAWASCYDSIVLDLSGGLDSSIVAACLSNAINGPEVLCFHYFTEITEGDERTYAREAAHSAGLELIERVISARETTLEDQLDRTRVASPAFLGLIPPYLLLQQYLFTERQLGAIFSGQGGDHLFQAQRSKLIAAEYAHRHGIRPQLFRVVNETSGMTKQPIWSVLGTAVQYGLLRRSYNPIADQLEETRLLTPESRAAVASTDYSHPWVDSARRLPASKMNQVFNVVDCQPFNQWPCTFTEKIHPLISQPIIELCLQIPTYILTHRGKRRGLVREAFATSVPSIIIDREVKGSTTGYFNRMLLENSAFLREFLLDGSLVSQGIVDRHQLEQQLSEQQLLRGTEFRAILYAMRAEAWLTNWADVRHRSAA